MSLPSSLQLLPFFPDSLPDMEQPRLCSMGICTGAGLAEGEGSVPSPRRRRCSAPRSCTHGPRGTLMAHSTSAFLPKCLSSWPSQCSCTDSQGSQVEWQKQTPCCPSVVCSSQEIPAVWYLPGSSLKIPKENNPPDSSRPKQFWAGFWTNTGVCGFVCSQQALVSALTASPGTQGVGASRWPSQPHCDLGGERRARRPQRAVERDCAALFSSRSGPTATEAIACLGVRCLMPRPVALRHHRPVLILCFSLLLLHDQCRPAL